jgi:ATP-dependent DNA helicase RecG
MDPAARLTRLDLDTPLDAAGAPVLRRARALRQAGLERVGDLLYHLPFRYEDRTAFRPLAGLRPGERVTVAGRVLASRLIRTRRRGFVIVEAILDDGSAAARAVWYNQSYLARLLRPGVRLAAYGPVEAPRGRGGGVVLANPQIEILLEEEPGPAIHTGRVVPIYRRLGALSPRLLRTLQHGVVAALRDHLDDPLPAEVRRRLGLCERAEALRSIHFPAGPEPVELYNARRSRAHRRLIFEELFLLQVALALRRRRARGARRGFIYRTTPEMGERLRRVLPFRLTRAQRRVFREIVEDLRSPFPMNRLLQGDVGSGKTILALLAALVAVENGVQAALMAPTEILAMQHFRRMAQLLAPHPCRLALLTQGVAAAERRRIVADLAEGRVDFLIGTHALIQRPVGFRRLGLAVVDEQHRFGVAQRQALIDKGGRPDLLVMTATPIPRTLTLTLYGDLDLSVIDELPPGRRPVETFLAPPASRAALWERVRGEAGAGRRVFVIAPVIDESDARALRAATALAQRLRRDELRGVGVGLLHGRIEPQERASIMERFASGVLPVLVATSLVEVGIDVPQAAGMIIENAERFGLSQLHQLRGRVGRGGQPSWCALAPSEAADAEALERLRAFIACRDGFEVAEADLRLRGAGELFGSRQSGEGELRLADLIRHGALVEQARREAFAWVEGRLAAGEPIDPQVLAEVRRRWPGEALGLTEG